MVYLGICVAIFIIEFVIKNWIEKKGKSGTTKPILSGKILLKKHHNKGAMLNIGWKKQTMMSGISLSLSILITVFALFFGKKKHKVAKLGLALLLGGAYSNTFDRIYRKYVVDYFSFGPKSGRISRMIFNISDFCIMIGAVLTVVGGMGDEDFSEGQICSENHGGLGSSQ